MTEFIRGRIGAGGPVTFAWFMEQALYHSAYGYYSSGRAAIGREGDYLTNVSLGPIFGELMAAQCAEIWARLGKPAEFTIVEQGAHDGQFAYDVLTATRHAHPAFFAALRYRIVEPFEQLAQAQTETLAAFTEHVRWSESLDELDPFCGVHFSNELLDAMPIHVVKWNGSEWLERYVAVDEDALAFTDLPITDPALRERVNRIPRPPAAGYETEVNLGALTWIDAVARKLTKGFAIAVDYGFPRDDYYAPHRTTGTLQCRAGHRMISSPLEQIGEADITAHVEWTSVAVRAEEAGLSLAGFTDQHHFITGLLDAVGAEAFDESVDPKNRRALQTLLHPGFLGMKFQFLVLSKGVENPQGLAGLKFARDSRATLGV